MCNDYQTYKVPYEDKCLWDAAGRSITSEVEAEYDQALRLLDEHYKPAALHCRRVSSIVQDFVTGLGVSPYAAKASGFAAGLHDIGKLEIPCSILAKHDRSRDERRTKNSHIDHGITIIEGMNLPSFLKAPCHEVVLYHHEKWNGHGPYRKADTETPLLSRIVTVADIFDHVANLHESQALPLSGTITAFTTCARGNPGRMDPELANAFIIHIQQKKPQALAHLRLLDTVPLTGVTPLPAAQPRR